MKLKVKLVLMSGIPTLVITLLTIFLLAGPFELESKKIALILVVALVIAQIVTTIMAVRTSRAITSSIDAVRQVAAGNLNVEMDDVALSRGDEIGVLARSLAGLRDELKYMFQDIGEHATSLLESAEHLNDTAQKNLATVDNVERAVGEIADGATSQAQDAQNASESVYAMGEMIEDTTKEVENLNVTADYMRKSSAEASRSLVELRNINDEVKEAIELIYEQTNRTNVSSQKIREATRLISSIAEETNLLSLNASIEAARAGEQGRSFAVVANQIQKLADQSNASADAIDNIINELINDSDEAVVTMEKVKEIINSQSENVANTETIVSQVMDGIEESIRGIEAIENRTVALNEARSSIVEVVQGLSAVAEENAASTQETSAATAEVANSFNEVTESAGVVKNAADKIADSMSNFQI
ncbi:MAG: HAMP domain-containing methyl-accepting chemotaxis protein [Clostridium sp.]|jgi:methyl-accepting chemotaxis protein|nr:HAMP domain-containing methyl-accepting chemotaxis protein [Clostridium sp.]